VHYVIIPTNLACLLCCVIQRHLIMVHSGTRNSYRLVDWIWLWSCLVYLCLPSTSVSLVLVMHWYYICIFRFFVTLFTLRFSELSLEWLAWCLWSTSISLVAFLEKVLFKWKYTFSKVDCIRSCKMDGCGDLFWWQGYCTCTYISLTELNWTLLENSSHEAKERWKQDTIIK